MTATLLALGLASMVLTFLLATIEESLWNVSRVRAEEMADEGIRGSAALLRILEDRSAYLSVTTFLRVCFQSATTVFVTLAVVGLVDGFWRPLLVAIAVMVLVSFMLVSVSPRTLGRQHSDGLARLGAPFVVWLRRILGPLARLLVLLANALTPGKGFRDGPFQSEAELRGLVDLAGENSLIEDDERAMIHSVFELGDTIAREVMVPRPDMVTIESDRKCRQGMSLFIRSGFSRVPVVGEGSDDILGMLYFKDLARRLNADPAAGDARVTTLMRPARFVPESKPIDDLMRDMQQAQNHVAIVVDEYGGTAGLVTMEDVIEEIVGEITDEYDRESPEVEELEDGTVRVDAGMDIDDLAEYFDVDIDEDEVATVGGLIGKTLGRVPIVGSTAEVAGLVLTAERMAGRRHRIATVLVERVEHLKEPASVAASGDQEEQS